MGSGVVVVLDNVLLGMIVLLPLTRFDFDRAYVPAALGTFNAVLFLFRKKTKPAL